MSTTMTFNSLRFAHLHSSELPSGHAGFYKPNTSGYLLYDAERRVKACIIANNRQGYFVVTATMTAEGIRYMYSTTSAEEAWLNIEGLTLMEQDTLVQAIEITPAAVK